MLWLILNLLLILRRVKEKDNNEKIEKAFLKLRN